MDPIALIASVHASGDGSAAIGYNSGMVSTGSGAINTVVDFGSLPAPAQVDGPADSVHLPSGHEPFVGRDAELDTLSRLSVAAATHMKRTGTTPEAYLACIELLPSWMDPVKQQRTVELMTLVRSPSRGGDRPGDVVSRALASEVGSRLVAPSCCRCNGPTPGCC